MIKTYGPTRYHGADQRGAVVPENPGSAGAEATTPATVLPNMALFRFYASSAMDGPAFVIEQLTNITPKVLDISCQIVA
jgi:hypothetical protein